jgi:hypothetical protein
MRMARLFHQPFSPRDMLLKREKANVRPFGITSSSLSIVIQIMSFWALGISRKRESPTNG